MPRGPLIRNRPPSRKWSSNGIRISRPNKKVSFTMLPSRKQKRSHHRARSVGRHSRPRQRYRTPRRTYNLYPSLKVYTSPPPRHVYHHYAPPTKSDTTERSSNASSERKRQSNHYGPCQNDEFSDCTTPGHVCVENMCVPREEFDYNKQNYDRIANGGEETVLI